MGIIWFILLMGFSSWLQGITSFGYALIAAPLALIFLSKEAMVISMVIISIFLNGSLMMRNRAKIDSKLLLLLLAGSCFGVPIGVLALKIIPFSWLKLLVGFLTVTFSLLLWRGSLKLPKSRLTTVIVGFLVGTLQSSISMSGPPVVLYLINQKMKKMEMKKILAILFFLISLLTLIVFYYRGELTLDNSAYGLISTPMVVWGGQLGNKMSNLLPVKTFRLIALGLMIATGFYTILTAV